MRGGGRGFRGRGRGDGNQRGSHRGQRWNRGRHGGGDGNRNHDSAKASCHQYRKCRPEDVGPRLSEADVGITEFIGQHEGFSAVMKHRFSDFQVNEIDCQGSIVKLTTLETPEASSEVVSVTDIERHDLIPIEIWDKLKDLANESSSDASKEVKDEDSTSCGTSSENISQIFSNSSAEGNSHVQLTEVKASNISLPATNRVLLDVSSLDKDSRRTIHTCVKKAFQNVTSDTIDENGKKFVAFKRGRDTRKEKREYRNGEYLYFVLHKRNMDTTETVTVISHKLGLRPGSLTFAGTKDRRGITSQLMCLRKGNPSRLFFVSKGIPNVFLGNYCFKPKPLQLGDLRGNQFRIALRNVQGSDKQIDAGLKSLKMNGFINYFGLQRFGTNIAVPTHVVGKALLLGDWQRAVDLILEPRDNFPTMTPALNEWKNSRDANAALKKLNERSNCIEDLLLRGLAARGPTDLVNALSVIPLNTRLMYLHAYQSYIWNQTLSYRIKEFGFKPIVGDLVIVRAEGDKHCDDLSIIAEDSGLTESVPKDCKEGGIRPEVKCITEDNISDYSIEDIVLPLPGHDVTYPINRVGIFLLDLLKKDGLSPEKLQNHVKQYSVSGTYRHILARANNLSWKVVKYNNSAEDLIASDYDEMQQKLPSGESEDGEFKAIILTMCLEPSTYATMAVREVTKKDTSAAAQVLLSAATVSSSKDERSLNTVAHQAVVDLLTEKAAAGVSSKESSVAKEETLDCPQKESVGIVIETEDKTLTSKILEPTIGHSTIGDSVAPPNCPECADKKEGISSENKVALKRRVEDVSDDRDTGKRAKENFETLD